VHTLLKTTASFVFAVAALTAVVAWIISHDVLTATSTPLAVLALAVVLLLHFRRDIAPDLWRQRFHGYWERNGFVLTFH